MKRFSGTATFGDGKREVVEGFYIYTEFAPAEYPDSWYFERDQRRLASVNGTIDSGSMGLGMMGVLSIRTGAAEDFVIPVIFKEDRQFFSVGRPIAGDPSSL